MFFFSVIFCEFFFFLKEPNQIQLKQKPMKQKKKKTNLEGNE